MKYLVTLLMLLGCCGNISSVPIKYEQTGPVTVGAIDWYHRNFVVIFNDGSIKPFNPVCNNEVLPVYQGMRTDFKYYWIDENHSYSADNGYAPDHTCYKIYDIKLVK